MDRGRAEDTEDRADKGLAAAVREEARGRRDKGKGDKDPSRVRGPEEGDTRTGPTAPRLRNSRIRDPLKINRHPKTEVKAILKRQSPGIPNREARKAKHLKIS